HNYYHWMLALLPKIGLLRESGINFKSIGKFVVSSQSERPFQRETLEILGIPSDRIVESLKYPYIKAKTLIVPKLFANMGEFGTIPKWGYEFIKKEFIKLGIQKNSEAFNGVYISRQDAPTRRVINESEVVNFLSKFGIKSVTLTSMSVIEQASLFAGAKVVVAPHGAGLTNLLFCRQGTKVIELIPHNDIRMWYYHLSNNCELDYYYLLGKSVTPQQDVKVNLDLLSELMKLAGLS
ncbi:MAG: glycosyltransferase family 61 protein, partial [Okeania sp. SIO3C4]|nr:glycosyltransferase family 61 protein [Okeania sp. SIO3C4]